MMIKYSRSFKSHHDMSWLVDLLNYQLSQKFKLLGYGKFNYLTNTSNKIKFTKEVQFHVFGYLVNYWMLIIREKNVRI